MKRFWLLTVVMLLSFATAKTTRAQTFKYTSGFWNWNSDGNWSTAGFPNAIGASATFNSPTGTQQVSLGQQITVGSISITNNGSNPFKLANGSGGQLNFDATSGDATLTSGGNSSSTNNVLFDATLNLVDNLRVFANNTSVNTSLSSGSSLDFAGFIQGPGGFIKEGEGTITFSGPSKLYSGATIINAGILRLASRNSNPTMSQSLTVNNGGQLRLDGSGDYQFSSLMVINLNGAGSAGANASTGALRTETATTHGLFNKVNIASNATVHVNSVGTLNLNGALTGSGLLTKTGLGTLSLWNSGNTHTGGFSITNGVLEVKPGSTISGPLGLAQTAGNNTTFTINNSQTVSELSSSWIDTTNTRTQTLNLNGAGTNLTINQASDTSFSDGAVSTLRSTIAGVGSLTKTGAGSLTLGGSNTYSGGTNINGGTLAISNAAALGTTGTISFGGGTLKYVGITTDLSSRFSNATNQAIKIDTNGNNLTFASSLASAGGSLTKSGAGTLTLSGSNSYSGGTNINGGTLAISNASALGTSGTISFGGGTLQYNGISTDLSSRFNSAANQAIKIDTNGNNVTFANGLTSSGGSLTKSGSGTLTLSASNSYSGGTALSAGTLALSGSGTLGSGTVTVSGGTLDLGGKTISNALGSVTGGAIINGTVTNNGGNYDLQSGTINSALAGTNGLQKTGSGTVTVAGNNSYSGATTVDAGKLVVDGSISHSNSNFIVKNLAIAEINGVVSASLVTVENGGTLAGSGSLNGNAIVSGKINPGNSPGTLTFNNGLVLNSTAELNFELNQTDRTIGGNVNDLIVVNGNLTLDGTLNVPGGTWNTSGTPASPFSWRLFNFTGILTDNGLTLGNVPTLTGTPAPQSWQLEIVTNQGGGGYVNLTAVPEPSLGFLLCGLLAGTLTLRRNRNAA